MMTQFDDVTEDLPLEMYPFLASPEETSPAEPVDAALPDNPATLSVSETQAKDTEDDVTVVELFKKHAEAPKQEPVRLIHYLLPSYSPQPLWINIASYLRDVRRRMVESREYDRVQYPNCLYQKLRRLAHKSFLHVQANLKS